MTSTIAQPDSTRLQAQPVSAGRGEGGSQRRGGERSEPPRSGEPPSPRIDPIDHPQSTVSHPSRHQRTETNEIPDKPTRRRFTVEYKRRIVEEADACCEPGQMGALLRREGLYSSHLSQWRRQRDKALLMGLSSRKRGRKPKQDPKAKRIEQLERENARLLRDLEEAKIIIDIQKKTSQLLGIKLTASEHEKKLEDGDKR